MDCQTIAPAHFVFAGYRSTPFVYNTVLYVIVYKLFGGNKGITPTYTCCILFNQSVIQFFMNVPQFRAEFPNRVVPEYISQIDAV